MYFVNIPFSKKREAQELGALFNYDTDHRGWYIPESVSEENRIKILELKETEIIQQNSDVIIDNKINHYNEENIQPKEKNIQDLTNVSIINENELWEPILKTNDNLEIILHIKKYNMPNDEILRTKILQNIDRIRKMPNGYPVTYEDLTIYCENFKNLYPYEYVLNLLQNIRLDVSYIEAIQNSHMSDEDKALALFAVPI